jgi:hypothetical protein
MEEKQRTMQQNNALHLLFEQIAEKLNSAGYDMRRALPETIDIPWTKESVKEYLWRPIQEVMYQKHSTTQLLKQKEIDMIYEVLCRFLGEKLKIIMPIFPSVENAAIEK